MKHVGAYEVKTHLSRFLDEVASGEIIIVTRNGHPVAQICPIETRAGRVERLIEQTRRLRQRIARSGPAFTQRELRELVEEGRP